MLCSCARNDKKFTLRLLRNVHSACPVTTARPWLYFFNFFFFAKVGESCSNLCRWIFLHFYSGEQTFVLISPHKWTLGRGGKLFSVLWKAEPSPVFGLISSGREKRQRSPMAESGREVRTRAAGLSIHFTTSPYLQRMNYRCPHASSQEVDAVLTSRWGLRTKVNRVRKKKIPILLLRDCHPCGYSYFFHACRDGHFYNVSAPWVSGPKDSAMFSHINAGLLHSPVWLSQWRCGFCLWLSALWWPSQTSAGSESSSQSPRKSLARSGGSCWWCCICWC